MPGITKALKQILLSGSRVSGQSTASGVLTSRLTTLIALALFCGALAQVILRVLDTFAPPLPTQQNTSVQVSANKGMSYNLPRIQSANLFGTEKLSTQTVVKKTTLNIRVNGLLVNDVPAKSLAFLSLNGKQGVYRTGDAINGDDNILLESVSYEQIIIRHQGQLQKVPFKHREIAMKGITADDTVKQPVTTKSVATPLSQSTRDQLKAIRVSLQENPGLLGRYVSGQPYSKDGDLVGFRVRPGSDDTLFRKMGFITGDILLNVNDMSLFDSNNLSALSELLANAGEVDLEIERDGKVIRKTIRF